MRSLYLVKPYLDLCRVSNLPTVWTNVLAAVVLSGVPFSWPDFLVLIASMSLFYSGGMCLNDLFDAEVDRINKPFRPIPLARITKRKAILFTVILFAVAQTLLLLVPYLMVFYLGLLLLGIIVVYDWIHKKHPATVILMGGCRLMVFAVSGTAVSGTMQWPAVVGGSVQFFYILVLSLISRYESRLKGGFSFPSIPWMLAGISLLDGIVMAVFGYPFWFVAGLIGMILTRFGQKYVRGD